MTDGVIFRAQPEIKGPALHAFIIGVGAYPYLLGGKGPIFKKNKGMGQLPEAVLSARAFADWLLDPNDGYCDENRPLGTIRLLLSEAQSAPYVAPDGRVTENLPKATMESIVAVAANWLEDIDSHEDNLAIFYFSGHGLKANLEQALVTEDFGRIPTAASLDLIRLNSLRSALAVTAKARQQVYFIDACRTEFDDFATEYGSLGFSVVDPDTTKKHTRPCAVPLFNATAPKLSAYAVPGKVSLFTSALIEALKGAAASNSDDSRVYKPDANNLNSAINALLAIEFENVGLGPYEQINIGDQMQKVLIGRLKGKPRVRVRARCDPADHDTDAWFKHADIGDWQVGTRPEPRVTVGRQSFTIALPGKTVVRDEDVVTPVSNIFFNLR